MALLGDLHNFSGGSNLNNFLQGQPSVGPLHRASSSLAMSAHARRCAGRESPSRDMAVKVSKKRGEGEGNGGPD